MKVDNALDREYVIGLIESLTEAFEQPGASGNPSIANAFRLLIESLSGEQYKLWARRSQTVIYLEDEIERQAGYIESASIALKDHFYQQAYVGSIPFQAVEMALWHLDGEPDQGEE